MPDFDKDLNPILINTDSSPLDLPNPATPVPRAYADLGGGKGGGSAVNSFFGNGPVVSNMLPTVTSKELYDNRRYGTYSAGIVDLEDQKAYAQSGWDKAANGVLKGLNLAGTTVAGSFGMLLGAAKAPFSGRLADIWDNPIMRRLDEINNEVDQIYLPNYYTNEEKNANWYSTDNWFKTNFLFDKLVKNSGFAVGAMLSGNIANAGLIRAGAALGRAAAAGATAAEASQAFKLFTPLLKNTSRAFSAGKNVEAAAILEKEISSIADITARSSKLADIARQTNKFANFGDTGRRTLIAAYSSAGEASFEALQTANQFRDNLIEEYKSKHQGLEPVGPDLDNINEMSEKVGKTAFFGNMALLSVTEYVQLPKLLGSSYSSSRQAANSLLGRTDDVLMKDGKYIAKPTSTTKFGKLYDKVTGIGRYVFDPKEAGQEIGQYALQVGTQNYFNKAYQTNAADEWVDGFLYGLVGRTESGEGVGAFVSKEGMESGLLGGITGGLMQAKGTFQEDRAVKSATQQFLSQINTAPSFQKAFQDRMAAINRGVVLQQQQEDAVIQGDKLEAKDLDADMMHNYLAPRIKYGRFDMVMDDIAELRGQAMTEQGLPALKEQGIANINDDSDTFMARLSLFETTANNMSELYKSLNLRYGGQLDESGRRLYTDDVIDKMVYAASKVADYDLRIPQVAQNLLNSGIIIDDAIKAAVQGTEEEAKKSEEDVMLQIDKLDSVNKDDLKLEFAETRELTLRRKKFLDEYNDIKDKPAEYREAESVPDLPVDENVESKKIKVKTKAGEIDLEVGTEYFLGNITKKDKDGNDIKGFPRLTILGENEDGTIKIKDSNGKLHDMTRAELAKFKLGKVSSTLANKKAKFYLENILNTFEFNFGKGRKQQGYLEYSPKEGILEFVYRNKKGELKTIEVTGDQFVAKDGFLEPMIKKVGERTAAEQQLTEQFAAEQDVRKVDKRAARLSVLNNLFNEISANQKKVENLLQQKKNELNTITKELNTLKKNVASGSVSFKSVVNDSVKAANRLSRMQEQLRLEIETLEAERNEAELTLEWISDLASNIDELPTDSVDFLAELRDQRNTLQDLILESGNTINELSNLINRAEDALKSAIDLVNRWVGQFEKAYPKVPTALGQDWVDFLKANPNFLKLAPKYKEDLAMLEDMVAQIEDFTIKPVEKEIDDLRNELEKVQSALKEAEQQLKIKDTIVSRFEQVAKEYQEQKAQEERILKNEALIAEVLGTADAGLQTRPYDSTYEAASKKSDVAVVTSTKTPSKSNQPHVKRANLFGIKLPTLKNKDKIKGVVVSAKNEAEFGLGGLTQHLKDVSNAPEAEKAKIEPSKTVVLVMVVETKSGSYVPVDVNGEPLENVSVETAIYQTFPDPNLEWSEEYGGGTMFREETPKDRIEYYKKEYGEWHQEMLDNPTNVPHNIQASFGRPALPERLNEEGKSEKIYDAKTPVIDAGLIKESDLDKAPVVYIPTTNNVVSKGSTFFDSPLGRPFLSLANAYVKLMNRKLTKNEASTIYEAIYQLSLDINENGNAKSEKSKRLINWLRSIVYWGTPKNASGYNSIFFDKTEDGLKIFFSGKGDSYFFTPQSIKDNKDRIMTILENMYNNVNSGLTDKIDTWNQPYEEIIGFDKDGNPIPREVDGNPYWPNYQTYLLSGKGRKGEEIPLTTQMRPLQDENDVNRDGVYFTLTDTADTERYNKPPKAAVAITPVAPGAPAPAVTPTAPVTPAPTANATGDYKFDGSEETIAVGDNGDAKFTVNLDEYEKSNGQKGFDIEALPDTTKKLMAKKGLTQEDAAKTIATFVVSKIKPLVEARIAARKAPAPSTEEVAKEEEVKPAEVVAPVKTEAAAPVVEPAKIVPPSAADMAIIREQMRNMSSKTPLRKKIEQEVKNFRPENWNQVEKWLRANFPNIPVYRVKNIIQATNGQQAWGMFKDGAIYIYENAEVGTAYHEVFHAVWRMFSDPVEQAAVIAEVKARPGMENATEAEIEELLAEEFRDYVQFKKIPGKPAKGRPFVLRLFTDMVNFIKELFTGKKVKSNTEELFSKIGTGYFAKHNPYHSSLAFAKEGIIDIEEAYASSDSAFRVKGIPADQVHAIMQQMTYTTLTDLIKDNKSLFTIPKLKGENKTKLYKRLLEDMQETVLQPAKAAEVSVEKGNITEAQAQPFYDSAFALWKSVTDNWEDIKKKHEEYLSTYGIEFDENDNIQLNSDERSKESGWMDATKIDSFKKANGAIKLLLSTIPVVNDKNDFIYSPINGVRLLPTSQVYMSLMNNLHTSRTIDEMMERLLDMAKNDPNYRTLYSRLTNTSYTSDTADLSQIDKVHDGQLLAAFWRTFKKQNPDVKNVFIFENGDIEVGDSNLSSAARQVASEYVENFKEVLTNTNPYFTYSKENKAYIGKPEGVKDIKESFKKSKSDSELLDKMISFLKTIGIDFKKEEIVKLSGDKQETFKAAVNGIIASIEKAKNIATISGKVLDFQGRFMGLSTLRAMINNPEFDSTFFNVKGERVQTFIGTNLMSDFFDVISQIKNKEELANTPFAYLLTDEFSQGSAILDKIFTKDGEKRSGVEQIMKVGYVDGTINQENGKKKESSKLNYKERLIQEINMNLKGWYYNLVPGDASIEWTAYMTNQITADSLLSGFARVNEIFKGYFLSELALSRSDRKIVKLKDRKPTDLRFMKPILGEELHNEIINAQGTPEEVHTRYANRINKAIENFVIQDAERMKAVMFEYGILKPTETGYSASNIAFQQAESMTTAEMNRQLNALSVNYIINNIELHKLVYSDPYLYKDELKRIKNFNSPRQAIINGSKKMNAAFQKVWNRGYSGIGLTDFEKDFFRTVTLDDVLATSDLENYGIFEETDGGGIITMGAYRNFRIRAGEWNDEEEGQFRYDVAYEKVKKGLELTKEEQSAYDKGNPGVKSAYTPIKPIVSGNKANGKSYNDVMLDKFALYPLSFRIMSELNPNSNAIKQYDKMQAEKIDYAVFATGRKVGSEFANPIYNEDGSFNTNEYEGIVNVPFNIISIQSEVPSKDTPLVTRGSQITKLVTLDTMEAGVPVDFEKGGKFEDRFKKWTALKTEEAKEAASPLYKEIKNNQTLLTNIMKEGYDQLLKEMGIVETVSKGKKSFRINNFEKAAKTLREEIMKREVNDNINDALTGFLNGEAVLEATPAYQQVRNILYSIADKRVISPKISGGQKVQIPSTFLEANRIKAEGKAGRVFSAPDDVLRFYKNEDGQRVCEIMVGRWFESSMSDEELLNYLNNTPEGQKILEGVAFRIPTQKQNSTDVFRIKKFLPKEFGDSVVIPSALVKKVGSDFDIDKLSIYFKNVLVNAKGEPKIVPFFGYGEQAKKKIDEWLIANELLTLFDVKKEDADAIEKLSAEDEEKDIADIDKYYKKSLENAYIESMQNLISHPDNFERLVNPNSADQLKKLANKITKQLGFEEFDYSSTGNMLSRRFMSRMRHAFVTGKYAIGIAAVNQTGHSLNQRQPIYIDVDRLDNVSLIDRFWLTGGTDSKEDINIKFDKFNRIEIDGKIVPTLSMIKNAAGQDISDINGQFIDGYVDISKGPWVMELGATPNVASTWLFLVKLGVPIEDVAYFMNQPIVRDYLRSIESDGYSFLFMEDYVDKMFEDPKYRVEGVANLKTIPSKTELFDMIGKKEFNTSEKLTQKFVLREFLKYAKMAEQAFHVTQGTNFDTSTFNDPYLVFKKEMQLIKAQQTIISSVDDLLKNSFLGELRGTIGDIRDAFAEMLISDKPKVRDIVQTVLMDYLELPDKEFIKVARKIVNDLFDWAVQVDTKLNTQVQNILLSENNTAKEITNFIKPIADNREHPLANNLVIKSLIPKFADSKDSRKPNNLKIKNKDNQVYDQNQMIYAFEELREYLKGENSPLYGKLIRLAVLQSGLSNSPISFTSLIPYEDFKKVYNKTLSTLETMDGLSNFTKLDVFQRNNWNDDDVVPYRKGKRKYNPVFNSSYYSELSFGSKEDLVRDMKVGRIPQVIKLSALSREADSDIIVYSWEVGTTKEKREMRAKGDFSFIKKGLFKKVYSGDAPLDYPTKYGNPQYIYKMINAWGDTFRANEFYDVARKSAIDNGFIPVENEVSDETIVAYFEGSVSVPVQESAASISNIEIVDRYTDADVKSNPNKIYVFGDNAQRTGTGGQAQIRNNPNAMGIATKLAPSMEESAFMTDKDLAKNKAVIDGDIAKIKATGKPLVFPKDGLGTGLAKLKEKAPQTYAYLKQRLLQEFGFDNDARQVSATDPKIQELKDKIEVFEITIQNGLAGPDEFKTLDYLYRELGKLIKSQC